MPSAAVNTLENLAANARKPGFLRANPDVAFIIFPPTGDELAGQAIFRRQQICRAIGADMPNARAVFDDP